MTKNDTIFGLSSDNGRWFFVIIGVIINLCLGTVFSWSVFRKPLETLFHVGATYSGLPYTIFLVFFAILMPVAGGILDKYGPRMMAIVGGIIVGLGWILSGFASTITGVSLTYGIIAGAGVGITYGVPIAIATRWFPDKKGLVVGITLIGFGLSPMITAPLARFLIDLYGPLRTFSALGISFLILIVLCAIPLRFPQGQLQDKKNNIQDNLINGTAIDFTISEMIRTSNFYGLWLCYIIGTFSGLMAIGISGPVGQEIIKLDAATAALFVSIFAIFNGIGRPLFGWLTDKLTLQFTAIISFIIIFFASLGMITADEAEIRLYTVCFCGFWLTLGGWLAMAPASTATFFGMNNYSKKYGVIYTAYGIGAIFGTILSSQLRDILGSYKFAFIPTAILAIIGIIIAILLLKHPKEQSKSLP